eukprot:m.505529 g.505529  ORF g.505529 m.505529 type:complete len:50 (-) comp78661_c0_seq1:62-211(-)
MGSCFSFQLFCCALVLLLLVVFSKLGLGHNKVATNTPIKKRRCSPENTL